MRILEYASLDKLMCMNFQPSFVLDLGANKGDFTRKYLQKLGEAKFIMFDGSDHKGEWKDLFLSGRVNGTVTLLDKVDHLVEWYENKGERSTGNSIFKETTSFYKKVVPRRKPAYQLDGFLERMGWQYRQWQK